MMHVNEAWRPSDLYEETWRNEVNGQDPETYTPDTAEDTEVEEDDYYEDGDEPECDNGYDYISEIQNEYEEAENEDALYEDDLEEAERDEYEANA